MLLIMFLIRKVLSDGNLEVLDLHNKTELGPNRHSGVEVTSHQVQALSDSIGVILLGRWR